MALLPRDNNEDLQPANVWPPAPGNVQNVPAPAMYVLRQLDFVVTAGQRLAETLPSVNSVVQRIEREQAEMELVASNREQTDPVVRVELSRLKQEFQSCNTDAKHFLQACVAMAEYGIDEEIFQAINQDLQQGKLNELREFIQIVIQKLRRCRARLDIFDRSYQTVRQSAEESMRKYKAKVTGNNQEKKIAKWRHSNAWLGLHAARGFQFLSGATVCAGLILGRYGLISPTVAKVAFTTGVAAAVGSWGVQHYTAAVTMGEKETVVDCTAEERIFRNAQESISQLQESMDSVKQEIEEMWNHANQANEEIGGLNQEYIGPPENLPTTTAGYMNIQYQLRSLRSSMNSILDRLGPGGSNISTRNDAVVSNTVPEQESDTTDQTPNIRNVPGYRSSRRDSFESVPSIATTEYVITSIQETGQQDDNHEPSNIYPSSPRHSLRSHNTDSDNESLPLSEELTNDTNNVAQETKREEIERD